MPTTRELTISYDWQSRVSGYGSFVPSIRLRGEWLERAGFEIGQKVCVDVQEDRLIIKKGAQEDGEV